MHIVIRIRREALALLIAAAVFLSAGGSVWYWRSVTRTEASQQDFIKWVDFNATLPALERALALDIEGYENETPVSWIVLLAYAAAKNGNRFDTNNGFTYMEEMAKGVREGKPLSDYTHNLPHYDYYYEAFTAVLAGFVGEFEVQIADSSAPDGMRWETQYGLKAFSPIAKNYPYTECDDFGVSREYGFKRKHLGHDMMGQVGTPIIAVEGGIVEAMGWNRYGGWRIGIRSHDTNRYYYYAHLRKNFPFALDLTVGDTVAAGDVIGYLGRTGYSTAENVNNLTTPHLHFGLQLIFDSSQIEGNNEIWIDVYPIVRLLSRHRSEAVKDPVTKNYTRVYNFRDLSPVEPGENPIPLRTAPT